MTHPLIVHEQCQGKGCDECEWTGHVEFFFEPPTPSPYYIKYFLNDDESGELLQASFLSTDQGWRWLQDNASCIEVFSQNF